MTCAYRVDPEQGVVYGLRGRPWRRRAKGYVQVRGSDGRYYSAHRLIWEAVNGPIPAGLEINHINGDKADNRIANLELVTPSENSLHAYRAGLTSARGEKNGRALLTAGQVRAIRELLAHGRSQRCLAGLYGVSPSTVRDIATGKNWGHIA